MEDPRATATVVLAAIPARYGATRFAGKPLAMIEGRPMIAWVVEAASRAMMVNEVAVVTDHPEIAEAARAAGARCVVSERPAESGSDRIAHLLAADSTPTAYDVIVNLQADEPLLEPDTIDAVVRGLLHEPGLDVATPVRALRAGESAQDPNLVKVAMTARAHALYFSRAVIPHGATPWIHIGMYAYRREAFDRFVAARPSDLERTERLEQLRALELGLVIGCVIVETEAIGVDTPADVQRVAPILARRTR